MKAELDVLSKAMASNIKVQAETNEANVRIKLLNEDIMKEREAVETIKENLMRKNKELSHDCEQMQ